ncbi:MAG: GGDEF domain-containing protein [Candidatus Brocadiia bacterium]
MERPRRPNEEELPELAERKARILFWGSLLLDVLIVFELVFAWHSMGTTGRVLQVFVIGMLLWSFVMSAHAFHLLSRLTRSRGDSAPGRFTDAHTGVFTLEYLNSCLEQERRRAEQSDVSAAVVCLDLRGLEKVNRSFGYTVGNIALKALANLMAEYIRPGDVLGRAGGAQFVMLMPETTEQQAEILAGKIAEAIEGYTLDLGKRGTIDYLNCEMGVAVFPLEGETPEEIIVAAHSKIPVPAA